MRAISGVGGLERPSGSVTPRAPQVMQDDLHLRFKGPIPPPPPPNFDQFHAEAQFPALLAVTRRWAVTRRRSPHARCVIPGLPPALPQLVAIDDCARSARHVVEDAALDKRVYARRRLRCISVLTTGAAEHPWRVRVPPFSSRPSLTGHCGHCWTCSLPPPSRE
jgi:hypothetical protein